jgi:hypothetical protein
LVKRCSCGDEMKLTLRTVIFAKHVSITNVPVYSCSICGRNDVFHGVKSDVGRLIGELGARPAPCSISFDSVNEWADVMIRAKHHSETLQLSEITRVAEERTNQLLDLWLIASSLNDEAWKLEIESRLAQLSVQYIA